MFSKESSLQMLSTRLKVGRDSKIFHPVRVRRVLVNWKQLQGPAVLLIDYPYKQAEA